MTVYLALGDSISIDDYTGVHGGGAPSQLARKLGLESRPSHPIHLHRHDLLGGLIHEYKAA